MANPNGYGHRDESLRAGDRDRPGGSSGLTVPDLVLRRSGRSGSAVVRLGN